MSIRTAPTDNRTPAGDASTNVATLHDALLDASPDVVSLVGPDHCWRLLAGGVERLLGYSPDALVGTDLSDLLHPDDQVALDGLLDIARRRPSATPSAEHRLRRADGGWRWVESIAVNRLADPRIAGIVLTTRDVTRRKLAEEDARQRDALHRALLDALPDVLFRYTRDGVYLEVHARRRSDLFVAPDQIVGRRVGDILPPDVAAPMQDAILRALEDGVPQTVEYALPFGPSLRTYEARLVAYAPDEVLAIVRDLSDRDAARRSRADVEAKFAALMEHGSDMMVVHDLDGKRRFVSPAAARLMGRPAAELVGTNSFEELPPPTVDALRAAMATCLRDPDAHPMFTVRQPYPDIGWRTLEVVATNMLDVPGIEGVLFNSRDVTEREESAAALRASQQLLEGAFNHTGVGMALSSPVGTILRVNQAYADLLGYTIDELVGRSVVDLAHPDEADLTRENVRRMARTELDSFRTERRYLRKDGSTIVTLLTVTVVRDDGGFPLYQVAQVQDITERKRFEEQLRHMATHDHLTGLANRALLMERIDALVHSPDDDGGAVLYLDLDGFKGVNDTLGHAVGDRLLKAVATAIAGQLDGRSLAARIGGDEFVVLVVGETDLAAVSDLAQRLVDAIADSPEVAGIGAPVSCSVGIALREPGQRATGLLRTADEALYAAKGSRRHRRSTDAPLPRQTFPG